MTTKNLSEATLQDLMLLWQYAKYQDKKFTDFYYDLVKDHPHVAATHDKLIDQVVAVEEEIENRAASYGLDFEYITSENFKDNPTH